ncbi:MAG TPA: tRNA (adenosine(37)-N6)-dimethylallyltransferase MiaA [Candidatus Dormibacteraeota bacterium]|nr:tRNA (adenosine(37)-N6)-dimethylallyltransferase MiaA [Candidatus Dormibacteraeota bacterium]
MKFPIVVIVGETASGKSDLAIDIAKKFNGEIINADSWAVYKNFNIGTAKPQPIDRKGVRHHLIDVANPNEGFSAAEFKKLAQEAIYKINNKGKLPIIVGGTGLYVDSLIYDYSFLPPSSNKSRQYYESLGLDQLKKMCIDLGYDSSRVDLNNKRRVIRFLENQGMYPTSKPLIDNVLIMGIKISPEKLEENIKQRTEKMMAIGLENEVRKLVTKYGWNIEPMKGIGYREFKDYFDKIINRQELIDRINKDTIKLVKKQRTWFKRNKSIQWYSNRFQFVDAITTIMNKFS